MDICAYGQEVIKLKKDSKPGGQKREIDIAFMNTTFEWSVVDRAQNVAFFQNNQVAQRAVNAFKFCFLDVNKLCGFHIERLAFAVCEKGQKDFTAKQLFDRMLEKPCHNSVELHTVFTDAIKEGLNKRDRRNLKETLTLQILKMQNVCKSMGC